MQGRNLVEVPVGAHQNALEFVHPAQRNEPCAGAAGARPQGRNVAALADRVRQMMVQMRVAQRRVSTVLHRENADAVVAEFIQKPAELGRQAQRTRMRAAGVPKNVKWGHEGGWCKHRAITLHRQLQAMR